MGDPQNLLINPRSSQTAYDLAAPFYDGWEWQEFWRTYEYPLIRRTIENFARQKSHEPSILDLGCGTGWYLDKLSEITSEFHGVDISEGMLKIAKARLGSGRLRRADLRTVVLRSNWYDVVLATRVLSHLNQLDYLLSQVQRCIKASGIFIISDIDPLHNYKFTKLPYFDRSIFAETYKYNRSSIDKKLRTLGFVFESGFEIGMDGASNELRSAGQLEQKTHSNPAGWIGVWRQFRKKEGRKRYSLRRWHSLPVNQDGSPAS